MRVREFSFRRCRSCASLFLADPPGEEALRALYASQSYFANPEFGRADAGGFHGYLDYLADRPQIERKFERVLSRLERHVGPGRLLDVGAGPGLMLAVAEARGWTALGVEINEWAAAYARERVGVEVRTGSLATAGDLPPGSFDAVTMMDLLEHVADPDGLVASAARLLRPGGGLAVLTPDAGSPVSRLLGARWPEVKRAPEHLVLFSVRGLGALLQRNGFEVLDHHSIGKASSLSTLVADVTPAWPAAGRVAARILGSGRLGERIVEVDPRTKFCLYARRMAEEAAPGPRRP